MTTTTLLNRNRMKFDIRNADHVHSYKEFLQTNSWAKGCPFVLEHPWTNVPDMIKDKVVRHYLEVASEKV